MAIYKIDELLNSLKSGKSDGYEYVDIREVGDDDSEPDTLFIEFLEDANSSETDIIDAVNLPKGYVARLK